MTAKEERREKARNLRYKKAAVNGLTLFEMIDKLDEIVEACDEVTYWEDSDMETLVEALDGDEEEAERFRLDFAGLSADAEQMLNDLQEAWKPERFDDVLVISGIGENNDDNFLIGYDSSEGDYFGLDPFEYQWAEKESVKRLERLTKNEILQQVAQTVRITFSFIGIQSRYQDLKAAIDILRETNKEYLDTVKQINQLYAALGDPYGWTYNVNRQYDKILEKLPREAWL